MYERLDEKQDSFDHVLVWEFLRDKVPKFEDVMFTRSTPSAFHQKKHQRALDSKFMEVESGDDVTLNRAVSMYRPPGAKAAKQQRVAESEKDHFRKAMLNAVTARNAFIVEQYTFALFASRRDDISDPFLTSGVASS